MLPLHTHTLHVTHEHQVNNQFAPVSIITRPHTTHYSTPTQSHSPAPGSTHSPHYSHPHRCKVPPAIEPEMQTSSRNWTSSNPANTQRILRWHNIIPQKQLVSCHDTSSLANRYTCGFKETFLLILFATVISHARDTNLWSKFSVCVCVCIYWEGEEKESGE